MDRKIHDEYYKLKHELNFKHKNKKEKDVSQKHKHILNKSKMNRFIKWYNMSHPNISSKANQISRISENLQMKKIKDEYINNESIVPVSVPNRIYDTQKGYSNNSLRKVMFNINTRSNEKIDENKINDKYVNLKNNKNYIKDTSNINSFNNTCIGSNKNRFNTSNSLNNSFSLVNQEENNSNLCKSGNINFNSSKDKCNVDKKISNKSLNNKNIIAVTCLNIPKPNKLQNPIKLIVNKNSEEIDKTKNPNNENKSDVNKDMNISNDNFVNLINAKEKENRKIESIENIEYDKFDKNLNKEKNNMNNNRCSTENSDKTQEELSEKDFQEKRNYLRNSSHGLHSSLIKCKNEMHILENRSPSLNTERSQKPSITWASQVQNNLNNTNYQNFYLNSDRNQSSIEYENVSEINFFAKPNIIELELRKFFNAKKSKFIERVIKGSPSSFRWISWVISAKLPVLRDTITYSILINADIPEKTDIQIKKDLHRTLSDFSKFNMENTQNILYNILKAFAINDKEVGYCQGMNFIAGFLLIMSDFNELETFYLMLSLFSSSFNNNLGIRGFFCEGFPLLELYVQSFNYLFERKMPALKKHFIYLEIPDAVWISKWFQTLFTLSLPIDFCIRIWDCLLSIGLEFLLSFTLAFINYIENDLLKLNDLIEVIEYFKKLTPFYIVENEGNLKVIEESLKIIEKINIEEIIFNSRKINLPKNFIKMQMKEYEKNINEKIINNPRETNNKLFMFEDLDVKYDDFLNDGKVLFSNLYEEGGNLNTNYNLVSQYTNNDNNKNFDENEIIYLNQNETNFNEYNLCDPNIYFEDNMNNSRIKICSINDSNYNHNHKNTENIKTASDNAYVKTHTSSDRCNYREKNDLKIKYPNDTNTSYSIQSQISSSNNFNNINNNNNNYIGNNSTSKNSNFKVSFYNNNKPYTVIKNISSLIINNALDKKEFDKGNIITSIRTDDTPYFNNDGTNAQNTTVSNFNLGEIQKKHSNNNLNKINTTNKQIQSNQTIKNILYNLEESKNVTCKSSIFPCNHNENRNICENIPNDINDWYLEGNTDDLESYRNGSIEHDDISDIENISNIGVKINNYTFNAKSNKTAKPNI